MRKDALDFYLTLVKDPAIVDSIFTLSSEENTNIPGPPVLNYVTFDGVNVTFDGDNITFED